MICENKKLAHLRFNSQFLYCWINNQYNQRLNKYIFYTSLNRIKILFIHSLKFNCVIQLVSIENKCLLIVTYRKKLFEISSSKVYLYIIKIHEDIDLDSYLIIIVWYFLSLSIDNKNKIERSLFNVFHKCKITISYYLTSPHCCGILGTTAYMLFKPQHGPLWLQTWS